jgi:hypothetical protein
MQYLTCYRPVHTSPTQGGAPVGSCCAADPGRAACPAAVPREPAAQLRAAPGECCAVEGRLHVHRGAPVSQFPRLLLAEWACLWLRLQARTALVGLFDTDMLPAQGLAALTLSPAALRGGPEGQPRAAGQEAAQQLLQQTRNRTLLVLPVRDPRGGDPHL